MRTRGQGTRGPGPALTPGLHFHILGRTQASRFPTPPPMLADGDSEGPSRWRRWDSSSCLCWQRPGLPTPRLGQTGALTMESNADTRLVMISSLRVKAELQRSGPQPLVGMSQRFPNKAMVTWMEGGRGGGRVLPPTPPGPQTPRAASTSQVGRIRDWPPLSPRGHVHAGVRPPTGLDREKPAHSSGQARAPAARQPGSVVHGVSPRSATPGLSPVPRPVCLAYLDCQLPLHVALATALPPPCSHTLHGSLLPR